MVSHTISVLNGRDGAVPNRGWSGPHGTPAMLPVQASCVPEGWRGGRCRRIGFSYREAFLEALGKALVFPRTLDVCNYRTG